MTKIKIYIIIALAALIVGLALGGTITYRFFVSGEIHRLNTVIEVKDREKAASNEALVAYFAEAPKEIEYKTIVKEVPKYVTNNPACDVSSDELELLNYSRTGMRHSEGITGADEEAGTPALPRRIPRPIEVEAHADCGVRFRQCYAIVKGIETYLEER